MALPKRYGCERDHVAIISTAMCKTTVSPLLMHWRYCGLALSHWYHSTHYVLNWCAKTWRYIGYHFLTLRWCRQMKKIPMKDKDMLVHIMVTIVKHISLASEATVSICLSWNRIILCKRPANERGHYIVMPYLIGWAQTQNDPCWNIQASTTEGFNTSVELCRVFKIEKLFYRYVEFRLCKKIPHQLLCMIKIFNLNFGWFNWKLSRHRKNYQFSYICW